MSAPASVRLESVPAAEALAGRHKVIICYDVTDDRRRARLCAYLTAFGSRVQKSVFEAVLTDSLISRLLEGLERYIDPREDDLRIYFLPPSGWEKIKAWGPNKDRRPGEELFFVV